MYENVLEKQQLCNKSTDLMWGLWNCAGSKLSFQPPQHLQTSNYNVKHLAGVALNLFKQRQDQASVITFFLNYFSSHLKIIQSYVDKQERLIKVRGFKSLMCPIACDHTQVII